MRDEYIIVLDFLSRGHADDRKGEPIVQGIGTKFFSLLEVVLKPGHQVKPGDTIYIGEKKWEEVKYIRGRIKYDDLTSFAKDELEKVISDLIDKNEKRFVEFFNKATPITTRLHSLELLQGIGKKHLWEIIKERKKRPFKDFQDLKKRIKMLPDPKKLVMRRIIDEFKEVDRHKLFIS